MLALCLTGVSQSGDTGYVNVSRLVASHPLHGVLAGLDRQIAALRGTLGVPGLADPALRTQHAVAALRNAAAGARVRVARLARQSTAGDLGAEGAALSTIVRLQGTGDTESSSYGVELNRATSASLTAFEAGTAQRTQRALEARSQQFHEKELALAFALARRDAGQRLLLRLKLTHLYLDRTDRAQLEAQRDALDRRQAAEIAALRQRDGAELAAYTREVQANAANANAAMTARLGGTASANLAIQSDVVAAKANAGEHSNLSAQIALFRSSYRSGADARDVAGGLAAASNDIATHFNSLAQADRESRTQTAAQIRGLEAQRDALYRAIVAQITRTANHVAAERGLGDVVLGGSRPKGSTDLTAAVRSELL
jgi:hypothetical protein